MSDRKLLEWAAKAAGIYLLWHERWGCWYDHNKRNESKYFQEWNPLTDDGDALRLAVKLRMSFQSTEDYVVCYAGTPSAMQFTEKATMGYSIEEATRRAIVRAAAEIGRNMK